MMSEKSRKYIGEILAPFFILGFGLLMPLSCFNRNNTGEINVPKLADAIKREEGTGHPYGIKSIHCSTESECRDVCIKTIRHRLKDFEKSNQTGIENFTNYLAKFYDAGDDRASQKRWIENVELFYFGK